MVPGDINMGKTGGRTMRRWIQRQRLKGEIRHLSEELARLPDGHPDIGHIATILMGLTAELRELRR